MFRVVTDFVQVPALFFLCDEQHCEFSLRGELQPNADIQTASVAFVQQAAHLGWIIGIGRHICPQHAAVLRKQAQAVQSRVKLANGIDVSRIVLMKH